MTAENYTDIKVGLGLVLIKDGRVLLSPRKLPNNGLGEYGGPGGSLEPGESFEECVRRELAEECGSDVRITNLRMLCAINYRGGQSQTHWVGVGFAADYVSGDIVLTEPDKHGSWEWYDSDNLPTPLYWPITKYLESYRTGERFFEI
jgi:8-oxo-dGTP diphosphatase